MDEVNSAFEYMDEEGTKEFSDDVLIATEELLDSYITPRIDGDSIEYEMPSAEATHRSLKQLNDSIDELYATHDSYMNNEIYELLQLACIVKGETMPIPTDIIVLGEGDIEDIVADDIAEDHPIRDEREGIRYRYYFNHEEGPLREISDNVKFIPCALYIYELGEWRVIGLTRETLENYWHKEREKISIEDRVLNGTDEMPPERVSEIVHESWNRIHAND